MIYMGSKRRISKYIKPFITKYLSEDKWYVEPFCGGMNMMDKVSHPKRIASDNNNYLIAMWKFLVETNLDFPDCIEKKDYDFWRTIFNNRKFKGKGITYEEAMIGWYGFMGSFNGRFFDGGYSGNNVGGRDYIGEQIRNTRNQIELLKGVVFNCSDYADLDVPRNSIIYCDIPYKGTKQYLTSKNFDYERFWQWVRDKSYEGSDVLISEYNAPEDFVEIWNGEITNSMNHTKTYITVEKLFVHESIKHKYIINL